MLRRIKSKDFRAGMTLVELMVAVAIASIIIVPLVNLLLKTTQASVFSKHETLALNLAQSEDLSAMAGTADEYHLHAMDTLRNNLSYTALAEFPADEGYEGFYTFPASTFTVDGKNFYRTAALQYVKWENSVLVSTGTDTGLVRIDVTVSWIRNNETKSVQLTSLASDWKDTE